MFTRLPGKVGFVDPLSVRYAKNSVVYPTIRVASRPGKLLMGVYDDADTYIDGTALNRRAGEQGEPVPRDLFPDVTDSEQPEAIYAGTLYFHFGHFLLESLARAWYAKQHPDIPLVWAGAHTWQTVKFKPWQSELLSLLGVTNPTRIIADPTRFESLHIPDVGFRYDDTFHPEHAEFLRCYEGSEQIPGRRLWLSRSEISTNVRDLSAAPTERRLQAEGWMVTHPERLTVREQLSALSQAEVIAGEEGSAFHTLVLLKDVSAKTFHILRRHGSEHRSFHTIGEVRQVNQTFYTLANERTLKAQGREVTKVNPNSAEILDVLGVPVPPAPPETPATPEEARLERIIGELAPRSLLDVGATSPRLVLHTEIQKRVAVSTRFDFDTRSYATEGLDLYELSLDRYGEVFQGNRGRFDVIRIVADDFDEFMASFRASLRLSNDATVWLFGSGGLAARAAVAVRLAHPGYGPRRLLVGRTMVYVVQRIPGTPRTESEVAGLSAYRVKRQIRWVPPTLLPILGRARTRRPGRPAGH